jgi:hypothetical protein
MNKMTKIKRIWKQILGICPECGTKKCYFKLCLFCMFDRWIGGLMINYKVTINNRNFKVPQ